MALSIEYKNTGDLIPYANNSRTHSDQQITQIASSIREFGFTNPILIDEKQNIIAGHGRVMAAQKLGINQVPTITLEGLTKAQKKAYVIADNKLALNAGWDADLLSIEIDGLNDVGFDLQLIGFTQEEINGLMDAPVFSPGTEEEQGRLDEKAKVICPNCGHEF